MIDMSARAEMTERVVAALGGLDLTRLQAALADAGWHNGHENPDDLESPIVPLDVSQIAERITDGLGMPAHKQLRANAAITLAAVAPIQEPPTRTHDDTCWQRHADCLASRTREQLGLGIG